MTTYIKYVAGFVLLLCQRSQFVESQQANHSDNSKQHAPKRIVGGISWNLTCWTQQGDIILYPTSGSVADGELCGILGPSGAGKSTLMSIIAGRPELSLHVKGQALHYFYDETDTHRNNAKHFTAIQQENVAWLQQQDAFFERLKVKETLDLAVFLEWPDLTKVERKAIAKECLGALGLQKVLSRQIGNAKNSRTAGRASLSGGELRRLSVALELVTNPQVFIADEPTTGLDSQMSEVVMAAISSLAKERRIPCFCTLHQPRSSIWHMLDSLILMAPGGQVCYVGSQNDSVDYFAALGFKCPAETNPAEYLVDLVSIDPENRSQAKLDRERINQLAAVFDKHRYTTENSMKTPSLEEVVATAALRSRQNKLPLTNPSKILRRWGALFLRSWRQATRSTILNIFRAIMSAGTALLLSQIFPSIAVKGMPKSKSVSDRICVLSFGAINMFLIAIVKALGVFSKEKPVIQREKNRKDYTNLEYLLAKAMAEWPIDMVSSLVFTSTLKLVTALTIRWRDLSSVFATMTLAGASLGYLLGSITKSEEAAIALAMPVVILMMVVGVLNPGGVDPTATTPLLVQWIKTISPVASAIEGLVVAEFEGKKFQSPSFFSMQRFRDLPRMGGLALVKDGDETLEALGLQESSLDSVLSHMRILSLMNFVFCWVGLRLTDSGWTKKAVAFLSLQKRKLVAFRDPNSRLKKSLQKKQNFQAAVKLPSVGYTFTLEARP